MQSYTSDPTCVPAWWTVGTAVDIYLSQSGQTVVVTAPGLHCEANFFGNVDTATPNRFDGLQPDHCIDCNYLLNGQVTADQLTAEYVFDDGTCRHVVTLLGSRVLY